MCVPSTWTRERLGQQSRLRPRAAASAYDGDTRTHSVPRTASPSWSPDSIPDLTWILTEKALTDSGRVRGLPPHRPFPTSEHRGVLRRSKGGTGKASTVMGETWGDCHPNKVMLCGCRTAEGARGPSAAVCGAVSAASLHRASIYPLPRASFSPGWGLAHAAAGVGEGLGRGARELGVRGKGWELEARGPRPDPVVPGSEAEAVFPLQADEGPGGDLPQRVTCHCRVH